MTLTELELKNLSRICGMYDCVAVFHSESKPSGVWLVGSSTNTYYGYLTLFDLEQISNKLDAKVAKLFAKYEEANHG